MNNMQDDNNHKDFRDFLKSIPKVKAGDDFERRLFRRLKDAETEKNASPSIRRLLSKSGHFSFSSLLKPSLVPAIGLTIVLLIFIAYYFNIAIFQKKQTDTEISQNTPNFQNPVTSGINKDTEKLFSSRETGVDENEKSLNRSSEKTPTPSTQSSDFDAGTVKDGIRTKDLEEETTIPKEERRTDEIRIEGKSNDDKVESEKKEMEPVMKKGDVNRFKDTGKQKGELDEKHVEGKDVNGSVEQNETISTGDSLSKTDSTKLKSRGQKSSKLGNISKDSLETPIKAQQEEKDSTKNK